MEKEIEHNKNILEWKGKIELQGKRSEKLYFLCVCVWDLQLKVVIWDCLTQLCFKNTLNSYKAFLIF